MSKSYFARNAKVDGNQSQLVADLRGMGFDVDPVHRLKNLYDMVVTGVPRWCDKAVAVRVEIKTKKGKLTEGEDTYWAKQKHTDNLIQARELDDVLRWFGWVD